MHGLPEYGEGFSHFGYVNPNAPKGGTLRLGIVGTFDTLNPFIVRGRPPQPPAFALQGTVYETLMVRSWDEPFSLYGLIAESLEVATDRSSVIFHINPKARWHDGKAITADDVLFSFAVLRDKGRPNHRTYYRKVEKAEKLDELAVRFVFKKSAGGKTDREMPLIMGLMPVLPKHDWQDRNFNQTTLRIPVGSGPYKIAKAEPGRRLILERNREYWGENLPPQKGMYNFDTIAMDFFRDDGVALQAFRAGAFDLRREQDPNKWAAAYTSSAKEKGQIKPERFEHKRTEAAVGFVLNTRRQLFQDRILREVLDLAFDFDWINRALFKGLYKRTQSFFPNSELSARGTPEGLEKEILEKYRRQLPNEIFSKPAVAQYAAESSQDRRSRLYEAAEKLKRAGYEILEERLYSPSGRQVSFEVMLSDPAEEKVALEWARALRQLGITAHVRTVDSSQYQARLTSFDYDVAVARWFNSLSPGNEQMFFWGSAAADQPGSRNYPGVKDPVVDSLAAAIPEAKTREELVAATRALDRVLLYGHYVVLLYHLGSDLIALWPDRVACPQKTPVYGPVLEAWWQPGLKDR